MHVNKDVYNVSLSYYQENLNRIVYS